MVNSDVRDELELHLNIGQAAQSMCPGAEPKNYNNDNYNYINEWSLFLINCGNILLANL